MGERGIWINSGAALFLLPGSDNRGATSPVRKLTINRQRVDALTPYRSGALFRRGHSSL